ncbi:transposase, partial [Nocardia carnea]|uniref:transposase n=1 Tax=Nocardia carnea TaxID=37328 RepID=UPI003D774305
MAAPNKYPDELKARAVRLHLESDPRPTIHKLAQQLGVHHEALRNWIRHADTGDQRPEPTANDLAEGNRRLRKQVAELERVNGILRFGECVFCLGARLGSVSKSSRSLGGGGTPPPKVNTPKIYGGGWGGGGVRAAGFLEQVATP